MLHPYTTAHEIEFIYRLGTHNDAGVVNMGRRELLDRYLQSLLLRREWGDISRDVVIRQCREAIAKLDERR